MANGTPVVQIPYTLVDTDGTIFSDAIIGPMTPTQYSNLIGGTVAPVITNTQNARFAAWKVAKATVPPDVPVTEETLNGILAEINDRVQNFSYNASQIGRNAKIADFLMTLQTIGQLVGVTITRVA